MGKLFFVTLGLVALSLLVAPKKLLASGDKVRGDKSEGPSYQLGVCPFYG
jgi:hypothetical protein